MRGFIRFGLVDGVINNEQVLKIVGEGTALRASIVMRHADAHVPARRYDRCQHRTL